MNFSRTLSVEDDCCCDDCLKQVITDDVNNILYSVNLGDVVSIAITTKRTDKEVDISIDYN